MKQLQNRGASYYGSFTHYPRDPLGKDIMLNRELSKYEEKKSKSARPRLQRVSVCERARGEGFAFFP